MMANQGMKDFIQEQFKRAGIDCNQQNSLGFHIHDERFYEKIFREGSLGLGEAYVDGWWDATHVDELIYHITKNHLESTLKPSFKQLAYLFKSVLFNRQSKSRATEVGRKHYDRGNELFTKMLDKNMMYSCAYWKNATDLNTAQQAKLDLICQKLMLKPGMKILDIGCGWGGFAKYVAENYQAQVVGITVSQQQLEVAKVRCKGLPITFLFQDYREIQGVFDRIVSIGQMEHVGYKNYLNYMQIVHRSLKEEGIFLLHTIGSNQTTKSVDPWINQYVFPNGQLPSAEQITHASNGLFILEDWHNFGADYDKTLMAWYANFVQNWKTLSMPEDKRFFRLWSYYLLSCAGAFRARMLQLWQIILVKTGIPGGYLSIR